MPYIDSPWNDHGTLLEPDRWYPEVGRDRWLERDSVALQREMWTLRSGPGEYAPGILSALSDIEKTNLIGVLGADLGSARRDGFFYLNSIEQLKNDPRDAAADDVVDKMAEWGFLSSYLPPAVGGPPPHESPRPWKKVLDWLFARLVDVERLSFNLVATLTNFLSDMGLSAVALGVSLVPEVSLEFPADICREAAHIRKVRAFLDSMHREMSEPTFVAL